MILSYNIVNVLIYLIILDDTKNNLNFDKTFM